MSLDQRPPLAVLTGALRHAYGFPLRRAVGATMAGAGVTLGLLAGLVAAIGLERALTIWNDQMALLLSSYARAGYHPVEVLRWAASLTPAHGTPSH